MCALFAATHPDRTRALIMYGAYAKGIADEDYPWAPQQVQVDLRRRNDRGGMGQRA